MVRKLKEEYENPIDNLIYIIVEKLDPILYKLNFTPNIITTLSLIIGLISAYFFYHKNYISIPLFIIAYILDCSDGYFARKYKMITKFGDYYDHISDQIKIFIIYYIIYNNKKFKNFNLYFGIFILLLLLLIYHLSIQELIYNKKNESNTLNILNNMEDINIDINNIKWSKYFGCGTIIMYTILIMYIYILQTK